jgi:iron complex outermembrane receptor protein
MRSGRFHGAWLSLCVFVLAVGMVSSPALSQGRSFHFEISNQSLSQALRDYGQISGQEIIFTEDIVAGRRPATLKGDFTAEEALNRLLLGTGLTAKRSPSGAVMILRADLQTSSGASSVITVDPAQAASVAAAGAAAGRVGGAAAGGASSSPAGGSGQGEPSTQLEEVLVTAQKRTERLQDVPVAVTALSADDLLGRNQLRFEDFYVNAPGLSVAPDQLEGTARLAIRGLTTGGLSNPTVGIVVDDVPYGSSTGIGSGYVVPNIDPSDLERIEILRGPQGTLYGASSMGGLVKYVTVDPSTDGLSGRFESDVDGVENGEGLGYGVRGSVNVPLGDTFAIRVSGFDRRDPGYIDNPLLHWDGVNRLDVYGGRLSALWKPSSDFSVKLSALYQNSETDGTSFVETGFADLQQGSARGAGGYRVTLQAYSATVKAVVGGFDLTSVTGYNINRNSFSFDLTPLFAPNQDAVGYPSPSDVKTTKVSQELRMETHLGDHIDWLIGVFYTHENTPQTQGILTTNFLTGAVTGSLVNIDFPSTFAEYAGYSDLTFKFTDQFDVQIGARESHDTQSYSQTESGPLVGSVLSQPEINSSDNAFTYLFTPRYKLSADLMAYARLASGYRPGGPNTNIALGLPSEYGPDKTLSYEIGVKGSTWDRMVSFDASLYYIDWKSIQLKLVDPTSDLGYTANGSRAKSEGLEVSAEAHPWEGGHLSAWGSYDDAALTQNFPPLAAYGMAGDRLPDSSRFSGNLSLQQDFPLPGSVTGFVGGAVSYFSDSEGLFTSSAVRQVYPAYARTDLRGGARFGLWQVNLYANNVADKRAELSGGLGSTFPTYFQIIQPRTIGLSIVRKFNLE